jgi:hypothetical protein
MNKYTLSVMTFAKEVKEYIFNPNEKYIKWGAKNDIPFELLKLYDSVPEHASAINFIKTNLVGEGTPEIDFWLLNKLAEDFLIFGGFSAEVGKKRNGGGDVKWMDRSKVRWNPNKTRLGYADDWTQYRVNLIFYPVADSVSDAGIFVFDSARTRSDYPKPHYMAAALSLDTMSAILEYHNNNARTGFAPNVLINFNNGEPEEDVKREIEKQIKEKFTGTTGEKIILAFNESKETATTIDKIENDNLDQKFETLQKFIQNQTIVAHQITSAQLIGVKAENQGFSKTEFDQAMEVFDKIVVNGFRREFEYGLSKLYGKEIKLKKLEAVTALIDNPVGRPVGTTNKPNTETV